MDLLLELRTDAAGFDGPARAVSITCDPADTVAALVEALAAHVGRPPLGHGLVVVDEDRPLPAAAPLAAAGLLDGHTVKLVPARWLSDPPPLPAGHVGDLPHNRVPYRPVVVREVRFEPLPRPPEPPANRKLSLVATFLPMAGAIAMALLLRRPEFLLLAAVSPLLLIHRHVSGRRSGRHGYRRARQEFLERVEVRVGEVDRALADERADRRLAAPDLEELAQEVAGRGSRLWQRGRDAPDFLRLRLGTGTVPSLVSTSIERGGDPELRALAERRLAHHVEVDAPVTLDLVRHAVVGLHGDADGVGELARALVAQVASLHSPHDLVIFAAMPGPDRFLPWLPHVRSPASPLDGPHVAAGEGSATDLVRRLLRLAALRSGAGPERPWPHVLMLLHEATRPDPALVARLLDAAPDAGFAVLWLGTTPDRLPRQCRALVQLGPVSSLRFTDPSLDDRPFRPEALPREAAEHLARRLAPIRDVSGASTAAIPRSVPLLDGIGLPDPSAAAVLGRWSASPHTGLRAVIGRAADAPFAIDLVHDGPHALIGGTSGAGKSELLQTLVASLAVEHPPERLTFLFVDYKGGAGSADVRNLPHCVGTVTNLDGRLAVRVLVSLRAELTRRMALLEGRAKDLAELLERAPDEAPPRLVIVVDEFATLVKQIPEFVDGLIDVAQRGRSLGVHLVLATQRPGAAVNDNILGNTNLRIALRVVDPADSTSIVGSREAADIPVPCQGRAYARCGPGAVIPFQSAWATAPAMAHDVTRSIEVRPFGPSGDGSDEQGSEAAPPGRVDEGPERSVGRPTRQQGTQLEAVVAAVSEAAVESGRPRARRPWLDPLPEVVALDRVAGPVARRLEADPGRSIVIGLLDEPAEQSQPPAVVDLEDTGGLVVLGSGGSGKTTLLRTVAAGLARQGGAEAVELYGLDCAGRGLEPLAVLPNTAEIVPGDDVERVTRLIAVLSREVDRRRRLLAEVQAESVSALRARRGGSVVPRLVLLIDGLPALQARFDRSDVHEWLTLLFRLIGEGRQVGLHAVVTTDRRNLPLGLSSSLSARLVLRTAEPEEMAAFGVPSKVAREADLGPGRGFLQGASEVQVAVAGDDPSAAGQAAAIEARAGRSTAVPLRRGPAGRGRESRRPAVRRAGPLPELPEQVTAQAEPSGPFCVPLGLTDIDLEVLEVDLAQRHLAVCGPPRSGRSTALRSVTDTLARSGAVHLVGIGAGSGPLARLDVWDDAGFGPTAAGATLESVLDRFETADRRTRPGVVVIDTVEDLPQGLTPLLERLAKFEAVRFVAAAGTATWSRAHSGWLGEIRRRATVLVLQPENKSEVDQAAGVRPRFRPEQPFPAGRGVVVTGAVWTVLQVYQKA